MSKRDATPSIPHWEKDPQMSSAMLAALAEHPLTFDLTDQQRLDLVELAMREKKFNDLPWLESMVLRLRAGEAILPPELPEGTSTPGKAEPAAQEIPVSRPILVQSQEHLEAIVEAHSAWIKQTLEPGKDIISGRANLRGNDLRPYVLEGLDLRAANLESCDLRDVNLTGANLAGANLSRAQLQGARLDHAKLRRTNLSHADLSGACLHAADLRQIVTHFTRWEGADLSATVLAPKESETPNMEATKTVAENEESSEP